MHSNLRWNQNYDLFEPQYGIIVTEVIKFSLIGKFDL